MKLFFAYLKSRLPGILLFVLSYAVFTVSFLLYHLPMNALAYPLFLCLFFFIIYLLAGFFREKRKSDEIGKLIQNASSMISELPESNTLEGKSYRELCESLKRELAQLEVTEKQRYSDMIDYYTVWVHQIKTPISSMRLSLQSEDSPLSRKLHSDLFRIEQYVGMVLAYLRLDSESTDYVFRQCSVDGIIRQSVKKFASEFITRKIRLEYEETGYRTVTDEKWLAFVIEQILSNALKYTREGSIRICMTEPGMLCISDTGIGIAPEDLPRIFDKGYTGYNGRTDKSSSGIGLYICRRICKNLGIRISARSCPGKGTDIMLDLSAKPVITE